MPFGSRRLLARPAALALVLLCGCSRTDQPPAEERSPSSSPESKDSLAVSSGTGVEVWFTLTRTAKSVEGVPCVERGLEIRRDGKRIQVPLLYTRDTPMLLNDSTMRATLWTHCKPVGPYVVDLRSGRPVREPAGERP